MDKKLKTQFILREATSNDWASSTQILAQGEPALERMTDAAGRTYYLMKVGDGKSNFNSLPYFRQYNIQVLDHAPSKSETNENTITFVKYQG